MSRSSASGKSRQDMIWLSGWVFADLLLGLMMLFLVSTRGTPPPPPSPTETFTPTPTATATMTRTFTPTFTRTPTSTITPQKPRTALPPATGTPTVVVGLSQSPFTVTFRIDPEVLPELLAGNANARSTARNQLLSQMGGCFRDRRAQAGVVLAFGANPNPANGNRLAEEATRLLQEEYPGLFTQSVIRNFHTITSDPYANGSVDMEIYFITRPGLPEPVSELGETCAPPQTWCVGTGKAGVYVFNWNQSERLNFVLDDKPHSVSPARGGNPSYRCILTDEGTHTWRAESESSSVEGRVTAQQGENTFLYFCNENDTLVSDCGSAIKYK